MFDHVAEEVRGCRKSWEGEEGREVGMGWVRFLHSTAPHCGAEILEVGMRHRLVGGEALRRETYEETLKQRMICSMNCGPTGLKNFQHSKYPRGNVAQAHLQQVPSPRRQLRDDLRERHGGVVERELLELGEGAHVGPRGLGGRAQQLEDALQLVVDVAAGEQGAAGVRQFCKQWQHENDSLFLRKLLVPISQVKVLYCEPRSLFSISRAVHEVSLQNAPLHPYVCRITQPHTAPPFQA